MGLIIFFVLSQPYSFPLLNCIKMKPDVKVDSPEGWGCSGCLRTKKYETKMRLSSKVFFKAKSYLHNFFSKGRLTFDTSHILFWILIFNICLSPNMTKCQAKNDILVSKNISFLFLMLPSRSGWIFSVLIWSPA